jgi:ABC-2 type transport system ATP-binding protein
MAPVIEAEGLTKVYPGKVTLYNFTISINEGEFFGLLGPNGAGKSTFIRIITGAESADSGKIMLFGVPPSDQSMRKIGVAPQENSVYPLLTCMENLLYFGSLYGVTGGKARERAQKLLNDLELGDKANALAGVLSGGMKRRLNLACGLMHQPKIIILDEPTTGLDPSTRRNMWEVVTRIARENKATVLLTTHYMEEAEALCEKIAFVNSGQVVAQGTPEELKKMAGKEIAKLISIPGDYAGLEPVLRKIGGIDNVTVTEHGIVVESNEVSSKVAEITRAFGKKGEKIIELSVSKPSLEDVFLKLTGAQLKEAVKIGPKK